MGGWSMKKIIILVGGKYHPFEKAGKLIYGYQIQGNWLECGDKMRWLKSHFYLSLNDPDFGPELKNYLKEIN